ncbi:MAG TPA: methylenetetrahydrofolate reductase [Xanthobacteraceae bacterium]|nr:methylenetetrahydrofolate reductase [Xanthobacteraceae bacterium]
MAALTPFPAETFSAAVRRIATFMQNFSIEATRPSDAEIAAIAALRRGTRVYISSVPTRPAQESLDAAIRLRRAGFEPVPHVAVRNFASLAALDDFLARLNGEAEARSVLVIAGDRDECGPFRRALDAIDSGVLQRRGIGTVGIAGYPDGHPRVSDEELNRALADKITAAEATGLTVEIVTQFCFEARAILNFVARLRAFGFDHRLRIGLAGPTGLAALLRYATRCGVRSSAQALARRSGLIRQMFAMTTPDDLIRALAQAAPAGVDPHFFSFGGLGTTARWARAAAAGHIVLEGDGFVVASPPTRQQLDPENNNK